MMNEGRNSSLSLNTLVKVRAAHSRDSFVAKTL